MISGNFKVYMNPQDSRGSLLFEKPVTYEPPGRIAYVADGRRISDPGGSPAHPPTEGLPTQDDVDATSINGLQRFEFEVKGPADGFNNGGLTVEAANGRGTRLRAWVPAATVTGQDA